MRYFFRHFKIATTWTAAASIALTASFAQAQTDQADKEALKKACPAIDITETVLIQPDIDFSQDHWSKILMLEGKIEEEFIYPLKLIISLGTESSAYRNPEGKRTTLLAINSHGGRIDAQVDIGNAVKARKDEAELTTICLGQAHSMAAGLLTLGSRRYATSQCSIGFHEGLVDEAEAETSDHAKISREIGPFFMKDLRNILLRSKHIDQKCADYLTTGTKMKTMNGIQALRLGIIDSVLYLKKSAVDAAGGVEKFLFLDQKTADVSDALYLLNLLASGYVSMDGFRMEVRKDDPRAKDPRLQIK